MQISLLCNDEGRIINDPIVVRMEENEFWISISDSDVLLWVKGMAHHSKWTVEIDELDVAPMQIQGSKSLPLMVSVFGSQLGDLTYYPGYLVGYGNDHYQNGFYR